MAFSKPQTENASSTNHQNRSKMDCKDCRSHPKSLSHWDLLPNNINHEKDENKHPKNPWDVMGCQKHLFEAPGVSLGGVWCFIGGVKILRASVIILAPFFYYTSKLKQPSKTRFQTLSQQHSPPLAEPFSDPWVDPNTKPCCSIGSCPNTGIHWGFFKGPWVKYWYDYFPGMPGMPQKMIQKSSKTSAEGGFGWEKP